jgi:hypothetical protein
MFSNDELVDKAQSLAGLNSLSPVGGVKLKAVPRHFISVVLPNAAFSTTGARWRGRTEPLFCIPLS